MLLTFEFKSVEEAKEFLEGLTGGPRQVTGSDSGVVVASVPPEPGMPAAPVGPSKDSAPAPAKRGRKPKEAAPAPAPESGALPPGAVLGLDHCREVLADLFEAKGRDVCKGVLKQFDAAKVGDLAPAAYAEFIAACKRA